MKSHLIGLIAFSILATACGNSFKKDCKEFCEKLDDCGAPGSVDACREDCENELEDAENECRDAFSEVNECLNPLSCTEITSGTACPAELQEAASKCPDSCCDAEDSCNYADDGFCDCPDQAWDAADCVGY